MHTVKHQVRSQSVDIVIGSAVIASVGTTHGRGRTAAGPGHEPPNPAPTTAPREGGIVDEVPLQGWALAPAAARPPAAAYLSERINAGHLRRPRVHGTVLGPPRANATPAISASMITAPRRFIIKWIHLPGHGVQRTVGGTTSATREVSDCARSPIVRLPSQHLFHSAEKTNLMSSTPPTTAAPQGGSLEGVVRLQARGTTCTASRPRAVPAAVPHVPTMATHLVQPIVTLAMLQMAVLGIGR
jgi:hypothetical protein